MIDSKKLKRYFPEDQLEWRIQQVGYTEDFKTKEIKPWAKVLCYVQARAIENRLDEVIGAENWKTEFRADGSNIICRLSIWDKDKQEWIYKENGASETKIEAFKGGISDALKRCASHGWGIGRYLYELDITFAECSLERPANKKGWEKTSLDVKGKKETLYWKIPKMIDKFIPMPTNEELEGNM